MGERTHLNYYKSHPTHAYTQATNTYTRHPTSHEYVIKITTKQHRVGLLAVASKHLPLYIIIYLLRPLNIHVFCRSDMQTYIFLYISAILHISYNQYLLWSLSIDALNILIHLFIFLSKYQQLFLKRVLMETPPYYFKIKKSFTWHVQYLITFFASFSGILK